GRRGRSRLADALASASLLRCSRRMRRVGFADRNSARSRAPLNGPRPTWRAGHAPKVAKPRAEQCSVAGPRGRELAGGGEVAWRLRLQAQPCYVARGACAASALTTATPPGRVRR